MSKTEKVFVSVILTVLTTCIAGLAYFSVLSNADARACAEKGGQMVRLESGPRVCVARVEVVK